MLPFKDLTGQRFGSLTVVEYLGKDKWGSDKWKCRCDCGGISVARGTDLLRNKTKRCRACRAKKAGEAVFKDLTGQRFGSLTVIGITSERNKGGNKWLCMCDCGKTAVIPRQSLRSGQAISCSACGRARIGRALFKDLAGQRFGNLIVIEVSGKSKHGHYKWLCRCDCGEEAIVSGTNLTSGSSMRCRTCGYQHSGETNRKFSYEESNIRGLMSTYRSHAHKKRLDFTLTQEEFTDLISQNCFYCDAKPSNTAKYIKNKGEGFSYNGIDRVDSAYGYTRNNCVPCCGVCNTRYKRHASPEWIINAAKKIREGYTINDDWCSRSELEKKRIKRIYWKYKSSSKENSHSFNLTFQQVGAMVSDACFYCGKPASESGRMFKGQRVPYHGIDRIDNQYGYETWNAVPCCAKCNQHYKNGMPLDWILNSADKLEFFYKVKLR